MPKFSRFKKVQKYLIFLKGLNGPKGQEKCEKIEKVSYKFLDHFCFTKPISLTCLFPHSKSIFSSLEDINQALIYLPAAYFATRLDEIKACRLWVQLLCLCLLLLCHSTSYWIPSLIIFCSSLSVLKNFVKMLIKSGKILLFVKFHKNFMMKWNVV